MQIDPAVNRAKFELEVAILRKQEDAMRGWGCWVSRAEYPNIDVIFVPRKGIQFALPVGMTDPNGRSVIAAIEGEVPFLTGRAIGIRFDLTDYDIRAPSVTFRDPATWSLIPFSELPRAQVSEDGSSQLMSVVLDSHPTTKQPFLCLRAVREYHEHPQHSGDDWMLYRSATHVFTLVHRIWRLFIAELRPKMFLQTTALGLQMLVAWQVEKLKK